MIHTSPHPPVELPVCSVWDKVWSNPAGLADSEVAVIDGPSGRTHTRGDLKKKSQQLAYGYRQLGLTPGQVVCIFSPNSFYYHMIVLAAQCAGCVLSGANAAYTSQEMAHQLSDSSTELLMCHPSNLDVALKATKAVGWSEHKQKERIVLAVMTDEAGPAGNSEPRIMVALHPLSDLSTLIFSSTFLCTAYKSISDLVKSKHELTPFRVEDPKSTVAYLGYSSGTSGKAKGVRTSHYNMTSVLSILKPFVVTKDDVHLAVLPLNHIYGLTKLLHWPLITGSKVVVMPKFDLEPFCAIVQKYKCSVCMLVPPIALLLAREPIVDSYDFSSMRLIVSGAAPLSGELAEEVSKQLGAAVCQAYGLTETSPTTHYCPIETPTPGSIGPLLPMMRGRIVDPETGRDVEPGEQGEMWLQGPNVMLGYLNRPEANAETLVEDAHGRWLKTGDIAWVDQKGYYFITDRLKELIKYKGFQVAPAELEGTCLECPYVADVAVIGVWDDDQASELPRAYVVLSAEGKKQSDGAKAVREWVDQRVSAHKKLRGGVKIVDMVPKSPSGKLLRRILREEAKAEAAQAKAAKQKAKL
ncbi:BZ3500_MvSof-1268-A1-R1_Chr3-1g05514 [Microbotryum saponariae]|uniref:BZ3500_MvSof-1268-A1-R1_Chr3-1g05514 protein n=1 Tax=Microbotryum saponariae TaxID=289078 RepID=A0A2X0LQY3_9BASI|nr:BZ3500_MvSof-1268-A1-R1_Chr3-1g05514 [Microbotryum saponariae]SDA04705.1 BZ3501_MvSof-1269-A2-R1_Chr3-1g05185 [Microbotryum saponariae]